MNIYTLILSVFVLVIGFLISRTSLKFKKMILLSIAVILLMYKSAEYSFYIINQELDKIPIEFSTLAYFLFGIVIIFKIKELYAVAAFASFISGIGYLLVFIFMGSRYVEIHGFYSTVIAFTSHSILFIASVLLKNIVVAKTKDIKYIVIYTAIYVAYVFIINALIDLSASYIFINLLLQGDLLRNLLGTTDISIFTYILYYIIIHSIYGVIIFIFFKIYKDKRLPKNT